MTKAGTGKSPWGAPLPARLPLPHPGISPASKFSLHPFAPFLVQATLLGESEVHSKQPLSVLRAVQHPGLGLRVKGLGLRFRVQGSGIQGFGFWVWGFGW